MGASLDTPARCPLCNELTGEPVTLKCKHQFCQRCIGDLWSVTPNGPYRCPEWRCKTEYQTLPFGNNSPPPPPTTSRRARPRSPAGSSSNDEQNSFSSLLRRPALASRLLGKRKASTPAPEQPESKRCTVEAPREPPIEIPSTSSSDKTNVEPTNEAVILESTQSEKEDDISPVNTPDHPTVPTVEDPPADDEHQDTPVQQNNHKPAEEISMDDSDSSNEVDICDSPLLSTPKKATQEVTVTGSQISPMNHVNSDSSPMTSTLSRQQLPVYNVTKSSPMLPKHPSASPGFSSANFPRPQSKQSSPVPCHYCPKACQQTAVKTCLVCGASMCKEHLRPHLESPVFQNHTLVPPVEDISSWRCQEHQEINRIYCRQCAVCVCTVCTVIGSHRDHVCISIREAERELRGNLKEEIKQLQEAEEQVKNKLSEFTQKKDTFKVLLSDARAGVQQQYGAIREALEQEEQSALNCVSKEENRVLGGLEEKLCLLKSSLQSIQLGLHTLEGLADTKGDKRIQDQAFIMEYSKVSQLAGNMGNCVDQFEDPDEVDQGRMKCLQRWTEKRLDAVVITMPGKDRDLYRLLYGTVPILDADTAHPKLQLSENNRRVSYSDAQQLYTEHDARFSSFPQVLASSALEGGRWYWEVDVSMDEGRWKVGLCEGRIERKGQKDNSRLGFSSCSWCLACDRKKVEALHNKASAPVETDGLRKVGVFLDYEEGVVSFFSVTAGGSLDLMYSYKHRFTEPLYPAFSVSKTHLTICDLFQS